MILLLTASISAASWSLIFMIVSLILLFIAAFVTGSAAGSPPPWYARINFGFAGLFFYVLSVALG